MDNPTNPQNEPRVGDGSIPQTAGAETDRQQPPEQCVLSSICTAMRKGVEDARNAAEKAVPRMKSAANDAVYWAAYGVSFAAVFQWTVARSLAPECLKSGCRDGVKAGREAGEKWAHQLRQRKEEAAAPSPDQPGPSAGATEPQIC
jgi:hypothetical protein